MSSIEIPSSPTTSIRLPISAPSSKKREACLTDSPQPGTFFSKISATESRYLDHEIIGSIEGYLLASARAFERPQKAPTTDKVACVTGSSKFPPAGETAPQIVKDPSDPSFIFTAPPLS
ncbi:Uncharacterised protein [Chlamydia trachomatis]|nr:Uncharacterised protein [Chlamydia trachomatis]